jgi:glycosyltransferase involved in cell wall biosynthesis
VGHGKNAETLPKKTGTLIETNLILRFLHISFSNSGILTTKTFNGGSKVQRNDDFWPTISIVIPVRNGEEFIGECLDSILEADYPADRRQIIVVDDGSIDTTRDILNSYRDIQVLSTLSPSSPAENYCPKGLRDRFTSVSHGGASAARNLGVTHATGQIILFTDADCRVDAMWIKEMVDPFSDPRIVSVGGMQYACPEDPPFAQKVADFLAIAGMFGGYTKDRAPLAPKAADKGFRVVRHNPSCCSAYRKRIFDFILFDESLWPGEDLDFDVRLQKMSPGMIVFNSRAAVFHHRPKTLRQFIRMLFAYGRFSGGRLTRRYGPFRFLSLVPFLSILGAYMAKKRPSFGILLIAAIAVRMFAVLKETDRVIGTAGLIPVGFASWISGFALGFLEENG